MNPHPEGKRLPSDSYLDNPGDPRLVLVRFFNEIRIDQPKSHPGVVDLLLLVTLWKEEEVFISRITRELNVTSAAATGVADRFEQLGWANRFVRAGDRRAKYLSITPKGEQAVKQIFGLPANAPRGATVTLYL